MDKLQELRQEITLIDYQIKKFLGMRKKIILKIGHYKRKKGISVTDKQREKQILEETKGDFETKIFKTIIKESKKLQKDI